MTFILVYRATLKAHLPQKNWKHGRWAGPLNSLIINAWNCPKIWKLNLVKSTCIFESMTFLSLGSRTNRFLKGNTFISWNSYPVAILTVPLSMHRFLSWIRIEHRPIRRSTLVSFLIIHSKCPAAFCSFP